MKTMIRRGFTLTELLVVITLLAIIVAVGLPSFGAMLSGSNRTLAIGQVRAALASARDAAVRSTDSDSAAVFFFEPGGRVTILPCIQVGTMEDVDPVLPGAYPDVSVRRDVFARVGTNEPVQLPPGWMVRGFAGGERLDSPNNDTGWYPQAVAGRTYDRQAGSWVFPETDFYNVDADSDALGGPADTLRQTFMVRFEKGTGNLVVNQGSPAVVVAPRPSEKGSVTRQTGTPATTDWRRVDRASSVAQWAKRMLSRQVRGAASPNRGEVSPADLSALIGAESGDTVLAGSVDLIALYDEKSLAAAVGAKGLNRDSGSLYEKGVQPALDMTLFSGGNVDQVGQAIDDWIVGKLVQGGRPIPSDAVIYGFDRYTGQAREVKP